MLDKPLYYISPNDTKRSCIKYFEIYMYICIASRFLIVVDRNSNSRLVDSSCK